METLLLPFSPRFIVLTICAVVTALLIGIGIFDHNPKIWEILLIPIVIFGALALLGVRDLLQKNHAVLRNYPISAHIRFLLEEIRPEIRQYFFESEKDGMPFSRDTRALVYQRAKMVLDKRPFGTQEDVYREGYEWMHHSVAPKVHADEAFRITVGGPDCSKPYSASVFNISAMSFGALSPNAVRAHNAGAKGRLRARYRRGRRQPVSPREWRRHHLGGRLRLFWLPQSRRQLQSGRIRTHRNRRSDQDGRTQDQPGRQ